MAIPFYEDEHEVAAAAQVSSIADGDQVDGLVSVATNSAGLEFDEVDYEGPSAAATSPSLATATTTPASTEEQLLAWKMLALTMCKVLKQFYLQQKQQNSDGSNKSTKLTATVQIHPQTQQQQHHQ